MRYAIRLATYAVCDERLEIGERFDAFAFGEVEVVQRVAVRSDAEVALGLQIQRAQVKSRRLTATEQVI